MLHKNIFFLLKLDKSKNSSEKNKKKNQNRRQIFARCKLGQLPPKRAFCVRVLVGGWREDTDRKLNQGSEGFVSVTQIIRTLFELTLFGLV